MAGSPNLLPARLLRWAAVLLAAATPGALGSPSVIAGTEDGTLPSTRRCLDPSHEPVLVLGSSSRGVMIEEHTWHSANIVTAIAAILAQEHLGYQVTLNAAAEPASAPARAAFADGNLEVALTEGDGAQLRAAAQQGAEVYYLNFEVWGSELSRRDAFLRHERNILTMSGLGYEGREGWYMPFWLSEVCNAMAYPALWEKTDGGSALKAALYAHGQMVECPGEGFFANMSAWCPRAGRMMAVQTVDVYAQVLQREIIRNNNFKIALVRRNPADLDRFIDSAMNGSWGSSFGACGRNGTIPPFISYYWEPTVVASRNDLERLLLPSRNCGQVNGGVGTWKCDFSHDSLVKLGSRNIARHAPLLNDFLRRFSVHDIKPLLLNLSSTLAEGTSTGDAYWEIACDWVRNNQQTWIHWTATRASLPGWALVWDPLIFLGIFFAVFFGLLALCFINESTLVAGQDLRQPGNKWDWPLDWELGLPLVPWLQGLCDSGRKNSVAPTPYVAAPPPACALLWASSVFYGRISEGAVRICLLRFGSESQIAKPMSVELSTEDVTMHADGKLPRYIALDRCEVRFEAGQCAAWVSVGLDANGFWAPELRFRVRVEGGSCRGSRICTCVVWDPSTRWPGRTHREPRNHSPRKNLALCAGFLMWAARLHGVRQECFRYLYCVLEAIYDTVIVNYLFTTFVIKYCIEESHHEGLFYAALVHGLALCFKRCKGWRDTASGTAALHLALKHMVTLKAFDAGMSPSNIEASSARLFSLHTQIVDASLPVFYLGVFAILDDLVTLVAAPIYIIAFSFVNNPPTGNLAKISFFNMVPLLVMMTVSLCVGAKRESHVRDQLLGEMAQRHHDYMEQLSQASELRPLITAYGNAGAHDAATRLHKKGSLAYMKPLVKHNYFRLDSLFVLDSITTSAWAAGLVALALLHIDSKDYGVCRYDLSMLLMSLQLLSKVRTSLLGLGKNLATVYEGFHQSVGLTEYLNCSSTVTEQSARELELRLDELRLGPLLGAPYTDFAQRMSAPLSMKYSSAELPLGRSYLLHGLHSKTTEFCASLSGAHQNSHVQLPPFVQVLHLVPGLPEHFETDEDGMLLPAELLAFAESGRFTTEFAEQLRALLLPEDDEASEARGDAEEMDVQPVSPNKATESHSTPPRSPSRPPSSPSRPPSSPSKSVRSSRKSTRSPSKSTVKFTVLPDDLELLKVRAQQLTQALLMDPEVLILDLFFDGIPSTLCQGMLLAALDWQLGGPEMALRGRRRSVSEATIEPDAHEGVPEWLCRGGGVQRTLVLHLRDGAASRFASNLTGLDGIDVNGPVPRLMPPGSAPMTTRKSVHPASWSRDGFHF